MPNQTKPYLIFLLEQLVYTVVEKINIYLFVWLAEGCWFDSPCLHVKVSSGKILNPKLLLMCWQASVYECFFFMNYCKSLHSHEVKLNLTFLKFHPSIPDVQGSHSWLGREGKVEVFVRQWKDGYLNHRRRRITNGTIWNVLNEQWLRVEARLIWQVCGASGRSLKGSWHHRRLTQKTLWAPFEYSFLRTD